MIFKIFCIFLFPLNVWTKNDEPTPIVRIEWEKVNLTDLITYIPNEFKQIFENITQEDTLNLINILNTFHHIILEDDKILEKFTNQNISLVKSFKSLWKKIISKPNNITRKGNEFLKNLTKFHHDILENIISTNKEMIDYKRLRIEVYEITQEYLKLDDIDRMSFASSFKSLSNFFNNSILLNTLKSIKPNSSINDYINIRNRLINAIINGDFKQKI
uniref:Fatty-acid and retinol-binding protein 1 n=1 Tax=Parastrongyloides trichosuri TaxID=131310 RepID=A0A0N4ZZA0_PARTI